MALIEGTGGSTPPPRTNPQPAPRQPSRRDGPDGAARIGLAPSPLDRVREWFSPRATPRVLGDAAGKESSGRTSEWGGGSQYYQQGEEAPRLTPVGGPPPSTWSPTPVNPNEWQEYLDGNRSVEDMYGPSQWPGISDQGGRLGSRSPGGVTMSPVTNAGASVLPPVVFGQTPQVTTLQLPASTTPTQPLPAAGGGGGAIGGAVGGGGTSSAGSSGLGVASLNLNQFKHYLGGSRG